MPRDQWFSLPLELRQRYWRETDYARLAPSDDLAAAIAAVLNKPNGATTP